MNNTNKLPLVFGGVFILLLAFSIYWNFQIRKTGNVVDNLPLSTSTIPNTKSLEYRNSKYGFAFALPDSWKGYTIVADEWDGYSISTDITQQTTTQTGPLIFIRHPAWTEDVQRQDIPIMVFTLDQWSKLEKDEFHIGAAPIGPNEIGRNSKYVFAIPARYNFSYLVGFEEVEQIIQSKKFSTF